MGERLFHAGEVIAAATASPRQGEHRGQPGRSSRGNGGADSSSRPRSRLSSMEGPPTLPSRRAAASFPLTKAHGRGREARLWRPGRVLDGRVVGVHAATALPRLSRRSPDAWSPRSAGSRAGWASCRSGGCRRALLASAGAPLAAHADAVLTSRRFAFLTCSIFLSSHSAGSTPILLPQDRVRVGDAIAPSPGRVTRFRLPARTSPTAVPGRLVSSGCGGALQRPVPAPQLVRRQVRPVFANPPASGRCIRAASRCWARGAGHAEEVRHITGLHDARLAVAPAHALQVRPSVERVTSACVRNDTLGISSMRRMRVVDMLAAGSERTSRWTRFAVAARTPPPGQRVPCPPPPSASRLSCASRSAP